MATGASQQHLSWSFRIGRSTVGAIIKETCDVLWKVLQPIVLKPPNRECWEAIADDFLNLWNCPNCIGAMDGKHIAIKAPPNSGSYFYNYKHFFSIVLLATCDAKYRFVLVDVGDSGRHSDGGVFSNSKLGQMFHSNSLNLPPPRALPRTNVVVPMFFVADDAFPLKSGIMKPYPGRMLPISKQIYNYRLSRARIIIENTFGLLCSRWRIFYSFINCHPELAECIVQACIVLHNYLQIANEQYPLEQRQYCTPSDVDRFNSDGALLEGSWREELRSCNVNLHPIPHLGSNFYSRDASFIRDKLMDYFNGVGAVTWQWHRF